jgi:hypothetical protein
VGSFVIRYLLTFYDEFFGYWNLLSIVRGWRLVNIFWNLLRAAISWGLVIIFGNCLELLLVNFCWVFWLLEFISKKYFIFINVFLWNQLIDALFLGREYPKMITSYFI